jgi:manganese/iron transport system ATP-binding protein
MQKLQQSASSLRTKKWPAHDLNHPILELKEISVQYNGTPALDKVSFQLQRGERVAIIGPNGAGKSTLFNVISGMHTPTRGEVNIYGNIPGEHICIAYVPQRSQADWTFPVNVADVVMMGRVGKLGLFHWPKRKDWDVVHDALGLVSMEHLAGRQIGELSGGQQQRVFIARALAQEAELMLMDEPLTGLDVRSQEAIFSILDKLRERAVTILVATHDLNLAAERFDRLMLLNRKVLGLGLADEVFTPELLNLAYSGHMRLINTSNGTMFISDTCCGGGHHQ